MVHYWIPPKFVSIIQQLYSYSTCQVVHKGKLTEPFEVHTEVRQGCLLSATIFLLVVDWILKMTIQKGLEGLDFPQYQPTVTQATRRTAGAQLALEEAWSIGHQQHSSSGLGFGRLSSA